MRRRRERSLLKLGFAFLCSPVESPAAARARGSRAGQGSAWPGRTEAGGIFMAPSLSPRDGSGAGRSLRHPFPSPLVKEGDAVAPALGGSAPGAAGLCLATAAWCISPGHVPLLDEGSLSTASSKCQVPTYTLVRERDTAAFVFLFSCFLGRTLIFWKLLPDDGLRAISGSSRPSSWGLGLGTFARQPTPQKHPSAIYFFLLLCCLMDDSTFFCDWIALIYSF